MNEPATEAEVMEIIERIWYTPIKPKNTSITVDGGHRQGIPLFKKMCKDMGVKPNIVVGNLINGFVSGNVVVPTT